MDEKLEKEVTKYIEESCSTPDGVATFIGTHHVIRGQYHSCLIMFVGPDNELYNDERFARNTFQGYRYATVGAGGTRRLTLAGDLVYEDNRWKDCMLGIKKEMIPVAGINNVEVVQQLYELVQYYRENADIPMNYNPKEGEHNCNSFINGLLGALRVQVERPETRVLGWERPIAQEHFGVTEKAAERAMRQEIIVTPTGARIETRDRFFRGFRAPEAR